MGISPRRSAGFLPEHEESPDAHPSATPEAAPPHHRPLRHRARVGALVSGLALVISGGAALLSGAVTGPTAPDMTATAHRADPATANSAAPATSTAPAPGEAPAARIDQRPDRESARGPAAQSLTDITVVAGIPEPCSTDVVIGDDMSAADITGRAQQQWGLNLTGPQWQHDDYRPVVKLFAETIDSVDCTDYLNRVKAGNGGQLEISSQPTRSWAWGDYGLTRPNVLTLDFEKFRQGYADGDRGRLVRLIIHEMAHSLNADRFSEPGYWTAYNSVWAATGPVSDYGSTTTESFADAVGYYVARCAADNPYDSRAKIPYYEYVKNHIFGGREFGGAVGERQSCAIEGR